MDALLIQKIKSLIEGEVLFDEETLKKYSRDASVCEIKPQVVVYPKNTEDIKKIVSFVYENKENYKNLGITARSGGTDMSGGAIGESIILDMSRHITGIVAFEGNKVTVRPGTFYRDFEKETLKRGLLLPSYPASKNICTVGGMVGNNAAGEKTITYGQTNSYVKALKMVFEDGNEYIVKPLSKDELEKKISKNDFEGNLYKKIFALISENNLAILAAKPLTAKNAAGYYLWNVWLAAPLGVNGKTFDLTKLLTGSQGTLGIITEITFELVPDIPLTRMLVIYINDLKKIPDVVNLTLPYKPSSIESYDDATIKIIRKYMSDVILGHGYNLWRRIRLFLGLVMEFFSYTFHGGIPKLVMIAEFGGSDALTLENTVLKLQKDVDKAGFRNKAVFNKGSSLIFWSVRRESYNLLRRHSSGKSIATFIEDVIVPPGKLYLFLPKLNEILRSYNLTYSIAGHAGSGNFHIFPLMDFDDKEHAEKILEISEKIYDLVVSFGGSITAEHNDGISRTPFLYKMFPANILGYFKQTKDIFDQKNIFNPNKKVGATVEYFREHIVKN